ncbi:MAG: hypothetical protein E6Q94_12405 [Burkholderiaceae bacterium]|nr:MAG: hypothetical protein E6Q94_12405 [Burkholderiaceae bacterium]
MWTTLQTIRSVVPQRTSADLIRVCAWGLAALLGLGIAPLAQASEDAAGSASGSSAAALTIFLPDSGQPVMLSLPEGGSITASARQPGTAVQLVAVDSGTTVMMVVQGSALMQHSEGGRAVTGLARSDGLTMLTPSCVGAPVTVTVTGNTRTTFTDGCPVGMSGAGTQEPEYPSAGSIPAQDVRVFAPGSLNRRTLLVDLDVNALQQPTVTQPDAVTKTLATGFNVYVVALVPDQMAGSPVPVILQKLSTGGWGPLTAPLAALMSNVVPQTADARVLIEVVQDTDLSALVGTEIYLGYGITDEEMLQAGRFRAIYRIK